VLPTNTILMASKFPQRDWSSCASQDTK